MLTLMLTLGCAPGSNLFGVRGNPDQLALTATDFLLEARNGVDAQVFDSYNAANGTNQITLFDGSWGSSVSLNQYKILVSIDANGFVAAVRPYGSSSSIAIPSGGYVVAVNGTALPYLAGLVVGDELHVRAAGDCSPRTAGIPVVVYHSIGTSSAALEAHLQAIDAAGYNTITLEELQWYLEGGVDDCFHTMPSNPIVLTFDDGYADQFASAPALLDAYGMVGTFFVITSYPGVQSWAASWTNIADAVTNYPDAVELACHSNAAHVQVSGVANYLTMTDTQVTDDLVACHDALLTHTGIDTTALAWPFGSYTDHLNDLAHDAGFDLMVNTWPGINTPDNDAAPENVRRFGANVAASWATAEAPMNRWSVCP